MRWSLTPVRSIYAWMLWQFANATSRDREELDRLDLVLKVRRTTVPAR